MTSLFYLGFSGVFLVSALLIESILDRLFW
jgi:hypothetical protein